MSGLEKEQLRAIVAKVSPGFRVEKSLGGGMSEVYRLISDSGSQQRQRVLKLLTPAILDDIARLHKEETIRRALQRGQRPSNREIQQAEQDARQRTTTRFIREGEALRQLENPHVIRCLRFDRLPDEISYLLLEHAPGEPLSTLLMENPLPLHAAVEVAARIADGLAAMHHQKITHRDIKPDNVILDAWFPTKDCIIDGLKIIDLGIAKVRTQNAPIRTNAGAVLGTTLYMSPEQARGKEVDNRSDIFSLGLVFYEALTGTNPFYDEYHGRHLAKLQDEPPPPVAPGQLRINFGKCAHSAELFTRINEIILRTLAKSPDERYPTCREFMQDLLVLLNAQEAHRLSARLPSLHVIPGGKAHEPTRSIDVGDGGVAPGPAPPEWMDQEIERPPPNRSQVRPDEEKTAVGGAVEHVSPGAGHRAAAVATSSAASTSPAAALATPTAARAPVLAATVDANDGTAAARTAALSARPTLPPTSQGQARAPLAPIPPTGQAPAIRKSPPSPSQQPSPGQRIKEETLSAPIGGAAGVQVRDGAFSQPATAEAPRATPSPVVANPTGAQPGATEPLDGPRGLSSPPLAGRATLLLGKPLAPPAAHAEPRNADPPVATQAEGPLAPAAPPPHHAAASVASGPTVNRPASVPGRRRRRLGPVALTVIAATATGIIGQTLMSQRARRRVTEEAPRIVGIDRRVDEKPTAPAPSAATPVVAVPEVAATTPSAAYRDAAVDTATTEPAIAIPRPPVQGDPVLPPAGDGRRESTARPLAAVSIGQRAQPLPAGASSSGKRPQRPAAGSAPAPPSATAVPPPAPPPPPAIPSTAAERESYNAAADLLSDASLRYLHGDFNGAKVLAMQASALVRGRMPKAWKVIGLASCKLGDRPTALASWKKLGTDDRSSLVSTCAEAGVRIP